MTTKEQQKNCGKLADLLEGLPDNKVRMRDWADHHSHSCGTVGCALGWAAMSGAFPGLRWGFSYCPIDSWDRKYATTLEEVAKFSKDGGHTFPVIRGREAEFEETSNEYFGEDAFHAVFMKTRSTKEATVRRLRNIAAGRKP